MKPTKFYYYDYEFDDGLMQLKFIQDATDPTSESLIIWYNQGTDKQGIMLERTHKICCYDMVELGRIIQKTLNNINSQKFNSKMTGTTIMVTI